MNELALFAGAGGGLLASHLLGWRTVCAVEWNDYAAGILLARQRDGFLPDFPIWSDVRTFAGRPWRGIVDVVSGGFPCQAFSTATRGRPTAADMWPEMLRVIDEVEPMHVSAENVAERAIEQAARDLERIGYRASICRLSAKDLGADHVRERYWVRAHTDYESELRRDINAEMAERAIVRPSIWETFPDDPRMANGVAHRMERYIATGNGQVPCVAATAWRLLTPAQ